MKINEIMDIASDSWDQEQSDKAAKSVEIATMKKPKFKGDFGKHKLVPVTGLPDGFFLTYEKYNEGAGRLKTNKFIVALIDARESTEEPRVVTYIYFEPENVYFGEPNYSYITGMKVQLLGTHSDYAGKGYAKQVYKMLVDHGQILFSDTSQTPDGKRVWKNIISGGQFNVWGLQLDNSGSTLRLESAYGPLSANNYDVAAKMVYGGYANQFVMIPTTDSQTNELLASKRPTWWK